MNDLRHDQEAADAATHYNLRTVPMPDLRSPDARSLDAQARDLRTAGDKIAQLTADVDRLNREHELLVAQLRLVSEQIAALVVAVARA